MFDPGEGLVFLFAMGEFIEVGFMNEDHEIVFYEKYGAIPNDNVEMSIDQIVDLIKDICGSRETTEQALAKLKSVKRNVSRHQYCQDISSCYSEKNWLLRQPLTL